MTDHSTGPDSLLGALLRASLSAVVIVERPAESSVSRIIRSNQAAVSLPTAIMAALLDRCDEASLTGTAVAVDLPHQDEAGERWLRLTASREGAVVVGSAADITELRRTRQDLDDLKAAFDGAKREAERQREAAHAAGEAKTRFLATMSHELRTPMNAILGFTEIMDMKLYGLLGNEQYQDYVRMIHESGEHLLQLINAILDLSKAEQGMIELREDKIDVAGTAHACRRLLQTQADAKDIAFTLDLPDRPPPILWGDEFRVRQILLNILSNALKFTPDGGMVTFRIRCGSPGGDAPTDLEGGLMFEIADTGIGMRAEDIPIALAKFGQIDSSLSRRYDGTGLGLPLTKRLIELHGGSLRISSAPGAGTTVTVWFPRSRVIADGRRKADDTGMTRPTVRTLLNQYASN